MITYRYKNDELTPQTYLFSFGIKVLYGIIYILIYTYYFSDGQSIYGDTYRFMADSKIICSIAFQDFSVFFKLITGFGNLSPAEVNTYLTETQIWDYGNNGDWINDNRLVLRLNSLIHFISLNNIYTHALLFSFISFSGIHLLYHAFKENVENKKLFWYTLVLWPAIGFWGGSILKETLLVFAMGLWFYALIKLIRHYRFFTLLILITAGLILIFNKPYAGLLIIFSSLTICIGYLMNWKSSAIRFAVLLFIGGGIIITVLPIEMNLTNKISAKQRDLNNLGKGGIAFITDSSFCVFPYQSITHFEIQNKETIRVLKAARGQYKLFGQSEFHNFQINSSSQTYDIYLVYPPSNSYFETTPINYSVTTLLQNIPAALVNVFIRPFPWDNGDKMKILVFIFNLLLLGLLIFSLMKRRQLLQEEKYIVLTFLFIGLGIAIVIGLTIPIFGAIARYKLPVEIAVIMFSMIRLKKHPFSHEIP